MKLCWQNATNSEMNWTPHTPLSPRAVAIVAAADEAYQWWDDDDAQELRDTIRNLHDIDTTAAIERIKEQARQEERERCATIAEGFGCCHVPAEIAKAIREDE